MTRKFWLAAPLALALVAPLAHAAPALTPQQQAAHVLNRLAFGPRPGEIDTVAASGVQRYIASQLKPESIALPAALTARLAALEIVQQPAGVVLAQFVEARPMAKENDEQDKLRRREMVANIVRQTAEARLIRAVDSPRQLEEVMVDFWYNHFNVFSGKGVDRALVASYERDAIRPYAMGSFRELLGATAKHPAMLYYLDNWLSKAEQGAARPDAKGMKAKSSGLNENYARELMELHTLGVEGGYSQRDVTELARMLTGWTYDQRDMLNNDVTFQFDPKRHDHGDKVWLGQSVKDQGQAEGEYALDVLARHPATARHISYKLAQYFVNDQPSKALVERLARSYQDSKGDIRTVLRSLFSSEDFMAPQNVGAKFKTPYQFVVSALRAGGLPANNVDHLNASLNGLGMPLYGCPTPDGYKNTEQAWLNPEGLSRRIAFAASMAPAPEPGALQSALGPLLSVKTLATVAASPANLRSAMLLGGPDFMQR